MDQPETGISTQRIAAFMRQFTHDIRNRLNSLDLEAGLLDEVVTDPDGQASVKRMRKQLGSLAQQLRTLSSLFQEPEPITGPISARELFLIWREQHAGLARPPEITWVDELEEELVCVDASLMATVFTELLANAAAFSPASTLTATARRILQEVVFELRETKSEAISPAGWDQAFYSTRRSGYGLGLWAMPRLVRANGATFTQLYEPTEQALISRITMPVA